MSRVSAGGLVHRVGFERPVVAPDGHGGTEAGWTRIFEARAAYQFLRGGELVQAARLAGRQPVVATIRATPGAADITPAWRMIDLDTGTVYAVRAVVLTDERDAYEVTAESGVAA